MCGIFGIISKKDNLIDESFDAMGKYLQHRGPDANGKSHIVIADTQVYLGHVRLAILDLSDNGLQPMVSICQNYTLIYNGEIYNYVELREELEKNGCVFQTKTDTEVVLKALIHWGSEAFNKFNGMWGLAFFDKRKEELWLSRDRFGVKPLYYAQFGETLYFASELKSILVGAKKKFKLNHNVIYQFLTHSLLEYGVETFFEQIYKVPAATYLKFDIKKCYPITAKDFQPFWHYPKSQAQDASISESDLIMEMESLFTDAVRIRLRCDVPVGVTLSGGIDSSSITCKMRELMGNQTLNTFSIINDEKMYDERYFIHQVSNKFPTNAIQANMSLNTDSLLDTYQKIVWFNEQPVLSFSSVGFYYLMQLARQNGVKVILSGQGADEILCGYRKYLYFYLYQLMCNKKLLTGIKTTFDFLSNGTLLSQFNLHDAKRYFPLWLRQQQKSYLGAALKNIHLSSMLGSSCVMIDRQIQDICSTSVPSLLHYEDRLSMAEGIEIRLPFLDYRLVEFSLKLPTKLKLRDGWSKWIFRKAMEKVVPPEIIWRKDKQGFSIPQQIWFKNEFRKSVSNIFSQPMISEALNLVDSGSVRSYFNLFCKNKSGVSFREVYNPFALEMWLKQYAGFIDE